MATLIDSGPVLLDLDDAGIARIRLNRPAASNGMNVDLLVALHAAIMHCHGEPSIRVVILSGEGRHFCAGGDVKDFASKGDGLPDYLREATAWLQNATSALIQLGPPVIAQVQGFAAGGGGFGLVCAADLVIAGESAKFFSGAVRVGMAPDAGTTVTLPALVGQRQAMRILLTNPTLAAQEAFELGLITEVVPDQDLAARVQDIAMGLATSAPRALAETKRLLWAGLGATVHERLPDEARTVAALAGTQDALEGLAAVIERRPAHFTGR